MTPFDRIAALSDAYQRAFGFRPYATTRNGWYRIDGDGPYTPSEIDSIISKRNREAATREARNGHA